jgi:GH25 family lysozyme M1 (1,4-beta-N-acetylmuramidase)
MIRRLVLVLVFAAACGGGGEAFRGSNGRLGELGTTTSNLQICAAGPTVAGIDVSEWQGSIDWAAAASSGIVFAIARINDGHHSDPYFAANWNGIQANGLIRGAYQFYEPTIDPGTQAGWVINAVGQLGPGDLPVTLDVEWTTGTPNAADIQTWIDLVTQGTGKTPMIYTAVGYWNQYFNGEFADITLWVANYGVSCPHMPSSWSNWTFWQWGGAGVPGISGNVDQNVFNGTLADLQAFANVNVDKLPVGYLDVADCDTVAGWAQDPDGPTTPIAAHVYFNGPAGAGTGVPLVADQDRPDLCVPLGSCNHAFSMRSPRSLQDGAPHEVHAYGIDAQGGTNPELSNSPRTLACVPVETGVKRHVTDPTSYAAWQFDGFMDVRPMDDATLATILETGVWPAAPQLIRGDGAPEVWMVDGPFRRHVQDPESAAFWRFDLGSVAVEPLATVLAMPQGPDLRRRPTLIQGSGPAIYLLDDDLPVLPGPDAGTTGPDAGPDAGPVLADAGVVVPDAGPDAGPDSGPAVGPDAGPAPDGGSAGTADAGTEPGPSGGCGCSSPGLAPLALGLLPLLARRRRRS